MDFKQAGEKFAYLKAGFESGIFSESEFKAKLEDLMVRDEQGQWWMIGYETERWYRYDGSNWVQADPPMGSAPAAAPVKAATLQEPKQASAPSAIAPKGPPLQAVAAVGPLPRSAPTIEEQKQQPAAGISALRPSWWAVLGITLAWYLAWLLTALLYAGLTGDLLAAAIGGLLTGLVLRWQGLLKGRLSLLWFSLASILAGFLANILYLGWGLSFLLGGAIAGVLSGLVLRSDGLGLDGVAMARITASAALGWWVAWLFNSSGYAMLGSTFGGLAAGLVLVWALRDVSRHAMSL